MVINGIDVCIVTKNEIQAIKGLEHLPICNLIVETSSPLALARMRAIQKVETEWFAFIDDDVEINREWFKDGSRYVQDRVGAVEGITKIKGLGMKWDDALNSGRMIKRRVSELRIGERGLTHNTLIKTSLVKDWKPSRSDLTTYEDYEITQHVLKKGYRWLRVPVGACHVWSWHKVWTNGAWAMRGWKKLNLSPKVQARELLNRLAVAFSYMITMHKNPRSKVYFVCQNLACSWGIMHDC